MYARVELLLRLSDGSGHCLPLSDGLLLQRARKESMYLQTKSSASVQKNQLSVDDNEGWVPKQQMKLSHTPGALSELDYGGHASLAVQVCAQLLEFMLSPGAQKTSRIGSTLSSNGSVFLGTS